MPVLVIIGSEMYAVRVLPPNESRVCTDGQKVLDVSHVDPGRYITVRFLLDATRLQRRNNDSNFLIVQVR